MSTTRDATTETIERAGIVAVIRIKEPAQAARASSTRIAEGGVARARSDDDGARAPSS